VGVIKDGDYAEIPLCIEAEKLNFSTCVVEAQGKLNFSAVAALKAYIKKHGIDIIHTHFYKTDLVGGLAVIGTGCKVVSTPHGWANKPSFRLRAYELASMMIFPFLDAVVPLSEGLLNPLRRVPGLNPKLHFIRNAVDIREAEDQLEVAEEISALRRQGKFVVGYIGRLTPGKGLDTLLRTIAHYSELNWHVALIGEGEQASELESMAVGLGISDRIHFFGFRPDRLAFLKGFDAFVLPSRSEGIPRCLMESMAAEIPIIASDIPGCRNLIDGKNTGLLFPVDDSKVLGDRIRQLSQTPDFGKALTKNGKAFLEEHYSASRMAREYEQLYNSLISV